MTDDFVTVATVQGEVAGGQTRGFLEANGILVQVRGESLRLTHALTLDGIGAVEILVPRDQAEAARDLLAHADRGDFRIGDADDITAGGAE